MRLQSAILTIAIFGYLLFALVSGADRMSASVPSAERFARGPFRAEAGRASATVALSRNEIGLALKDARSAVRSDPVDPDSTAILATTLLAAEKYDDAAKAFRVAALFGWRNEATQIYWYAAAIQAGDYDVAADRLDAILRTHPKTVTNYDLLKIMEDTPGGLAALASRLPGAPPWVGAYLYVDENTPQDAIERKLKVLEAIPSDGPGLGCAAVTPLTRKLLELGDRRGAKILWNRNCPSEKVAGDLMNLRPQDLVANDAKSNPFGWHIVNSGDFETRFETRPDKSRVLLVQNQSPIARLVMWQTVSLKPGTYEIRMNDNSDKSSLEGARFTWGCGAKPQAPSPENALGANVSTRSMGSDCDRQVIGIWVAGKSSLQISNITIEAK